MIGSVLTVLTVLTAVLRLQRGCGNGVKSPESRIKSKTKKRARDNNVNKN